MYGIGKGLGTLSVWAGIVGLTYFFHSIDLLTGGGAALLVIAGLIGTYNIWDS